MKKDESIEDGKAPFSIKTAYIHLTHECNMRCKYCYFDAGQVLANELSLEELTVLFEDLVLLSPHKVVFTGGEPLLRSDFFAIAQVFHQVRAKRSIQLCLISNGQLIDNNTKSRIAGFFDEVRISIDGTEEVNDKLRGKGTFKAAINAINCLRIMGISPHVSVTVTTNNVQYLSSFMSYLLENEHVTNFHLSPFKPVGRGTQFPELACSGSEAEFAVAEFWNRHFGVTTQTQKNSKYSLANCGTCGVGKYINIHPNGSVYPCHVLSEPEFCLGNIREKKLSRIISESNLLQRLKLLDFKDISLITNMEQLPWNTSCVGDIYRKIPEKFSFIFSK